MLKKGIDIYKSDLSDINSETSNNKIDISILDKEYIIDGNLRDMDNNQITFQYKDDYYAPVSFITRELGVKFEDYQIG